MHIRTMTTDDLDFCVESVTREGWLSETRATFEMYLAHDQDGCFVAEEGGGAVGICCATAYETDGFLGELIVVPDRRGSGIGTQLMQHAINYLLKRGCASVYLDGDLPAVPLYERLGFRIVDDSLRFLGRIEGKRHEAIRPLSFSDLPALQALDRAEFCADRSFLLRHRLENYPKLAFGCDSDKGLSGFVMGQVGNGVITVGPWLVGHGVSDPVDLVASLACHAGDARVRFCVLESNAVAVQRLRQIGTLEETAPCRRMVLGPDSRLGRSNRLWALGSAGSG